MCIRDRDGLIVATIMAGIILTIMGFLKFGNLIRFIPYTITTGFTFGIAVTILVGQIKDFLGLDTSAYTGPTIETLDKLNAVFKCINTFNWQALVVGGVSLAILIIWPRFKKLEKIPASLIAVIVSVIMVKLGMQAKTIGDLYTISSKLPGISIPHVNITMVKNLLPDAFTIAVLAGIESLLSCVVSDGMIGSRHKPNMELVAQGAGNLVSALFGGIPATGAIARTAANVKMCIRDRIELLLFIIRCKNYEENVIKEIDVDNRIIQEVATYIYEHYADNLSLEYVADKFNLSRSYLSKKFKTATGFGFKEYIINVRIQNACNLLLETNKSITDIAFECGFNDSNYFGDAFRKAKGISPHKYRKNETF